MDFSGKFAKGVFYMGTLSSLALFLILTVDTQRQTAALTHADKLDERVIRGKKVFEKYNCNDCHTMLGFGGYYAPDLTRVYARIGEAGIQDALSRPDVRFAKSFRKMPVQHVKPDQIFDLVGFFAWVNEIENHGWPPQDEKYRKSATKGLVGAAVLSPGGALIQTKGCLSCHAIGGVGSTTGPALDHVGARMTAEALGIYIQNPAASNPKTLMPAQDLTPEELSALANFLAKQN